MPVHPIVQGLFMAMKEQKRDYQSLAIRSGVSRSAIHKWRERGNPSLLSLVAVAEVLGCELVLRKKEKEIKKETAR